MTTGTNTAFRPAIVVPAFARAAALDRLLASLARAHYPDGGVHLVISLDGGATPDVVACARAFEFPAGTAEVVEREHRLGLREHILWCGDQTERFGSVIVLEDDLLVDPWFYVYAQHALAEYDGEEAIAGIALFAPKYVENKLKFYPNILEAVVFGADRDYCTAFINIDLTAVGNWAERNNIAYGSYQELAGHAQVLNTIQGHIEEVNVSLAADEMLSGCQIHRFLVLHKELDADDGELTRTRKVRRRIVAERYEPLIAALYSDVDHAFISTEVTFEDGRKGEFSADLRIETAETYAPMQKAG